MLSRVISALGLAALGLAIQGCAAVGLTLFSIGAGTATGAGVGYTMDSIAYKTFTVPLPGLTSAVMMTLKRMDIPVSESKEVETGRVITARAGDRDVEIELDRLTSRTTRLRVVAKKNFFVRDRATATEIILQTDQTLTDNPQLAAVPSAPPANGQRPKSK